MSKTHVCQVFTKDPELDDVSFSRCILKLGEHIIIDHEDDLPEMKIVVRCIPAFRETIERSILVYLDGIEKMKQLMPRIAELAGPDSISIQMQDELPEFPNTLEVHCVGWED